jgi:hypothetical protein
LARNPRLDEALTPDGRAKARWQSGRRHQAALGAEVRRLARELNLSGPLTRSMLARRCHADHWGITTLDEAVSAGITQGQLRKLPFDFIDIERPRSAARTKGEPQPTPPNGGRQDVKRRARVRAARRTSRP